MIVPHRAGIGDPLSEIAVRIRWQIYLLYWGTKFHVFSSSHDVDPPSPKPVTVDDDGQATVFNGCPKLRPELKDQLHPID